MFLSSDKCQSLYVVAFILVTPTIYLCGPGPTYCEVLQASVAHKSNSLPTTDLKKLKYLVQTALLFKYHMQKQSSIGCNLLLLNFKSLSAFTTKLKLEKSIKQFMGLVRISARFF